MRFLLGLLAALLLLGPVSAQSRRQRLRAKHEQTNVTSLRELFAREREARGRKTLYGSDNRMEQSAVTDAGQLAAGAATAAIVQAGNLRYSSRSRSYSIVSPGWTLDQSRQSARSDAAPLCADQQYGSQPSLASCSGTLIGDDLFATAGHCISDDNSAGLCRRGPVSSQQYKVVFDYTSDSNTFPEANVFDIAEVVHCVVDDSYCYGSDGVTVDWAVLRLDRTPTGRVPATIQTSVASVGDPMYVVGHPSGLPRKYTAAQAAEVLQVRAGPRDSRNHANVHSLVTNIDSFSGNSGSGMFNGRTHEMVGILVEGGEDWMVEGGCSRAHTCGMDPVRNYEAGCPGEESVSSTVLLPFLFDGCPAGGCQNGGVCEAGSCACAAGYHGPDCSFKCDRGYCNNRGDCVGYDECECDSGQRWPPLCSVARVECTSHQSCDAGAYCADLADSGSHLCWECTDCEGITCERWGDSFDGACGVCDGTAPPPVPAERLPIACGEVVSGSTALSTSEVGNESGEHLYEFTLGEMQQVHFDSCNSDFDTHLHVMTADLRATVAECDDCGPCDFRSVLDVGLEAGDYVLVVEGYGTEHGPYEVQMTCMDTPEIALVAATVGGCSCMPVWTIASETCDDDAEAYHGCHAPPCDGDDGGVAGQSWCLIESAMGCNPYGSNWDYCVPGTWSDGVVGGEENSCGWAYDNICDEPTYCAWGTDTADCESGAPAVGAGTEGMYAWGDTSNSCTWAFDGECDDPSSWCEPGTDTSDCTLAANFTHIPFEYVDFDGNITCGGTVVGTTDGAGSHTGNRGGDHVYFFSTTVPLANVQFDSCNSDMDTFLRVMDHDLSQEFAACDDCGPCGLQTVLDTAALPPGDYALVVEGYSVSEGAYEVGMHCAMDTAGSEIYDGRIECGETVQGDTSEGVWRSDVDSGGNEASEHIYLFTVGDGGVANIEFDSCASEFDTYLMVMSPDLTHEYRSCDDCGPCETKTVLESGPLEPGEYALVIEGWHTSEGRYSVTMTCQTEEDSTWFEGEIGCGQRVNGTTADAGQHVYAFTVPEPGIWNLEFNSCGSSFDTQLQVSTADRLTVLTGCNDCGDCGQQAVLDTGFLAAGDYAVSIGTPMFNWLSTDGAYTLSMSCFADSAAVSYFDGSVSCGQSLAGDTTGAGSHRGSDASDHIYSFDIAAAGVLNVEFNSCGSGFDTHLRVLSADLRNEVSECDDCGHCGYASILDTGGLPAGSYALLVEGYGSSVGSYVVNMTCQNSTSDVQFFDGPIECGSVVTGSTLGAGSHRGSDSGDHIYYFSVPPGENIGVEFSSCDSEFDTHLRVYNHDLTEEIAECDDCGECSNRAVLNVVLGPGDYALLVEGWWYDEGTYTVGMTCSTAAENDVSDFVEADFSLLDGDAADSSGNARYLTLNGDAHIGVDGAFFDGSGDDITIGNFDYASDGTFSVSFWFSKEACTGGIYEYLYSHHERSGDDAFDFSFVNVYLGCEEAGGGWSTVAGSVVRYFVKDTAGTEALFDFSLHEAGDFNAVTNVWMHTIFAVTTAALATYNDGALVDDNHYGTYVSRSDADNAAAPYPGELDPPLVSPVAGDAGVVTFDLREDIFIGGRVDRNADRHFRGRIAALSVYSVPVSAPQAAFIYWEGVARVSPSLGASAIRDSALVDLWLVEGSNVDRSAFNRAVALNGNAQFHSTGATFDGSGDYITVENFDYASDGTFSVSLWFTKDQCTGSIYEYLFSHHNNAGAGTWDASYVDIYLGCESAGGGWSTTEGTVLRHWVRDVAGTEAMFDFSLHDAGDFDDLTSKWVHDIFTVTPTSLASYDDGDLVEDSTYGFHFDTDRNAANPSPSALSPSFASEAGEFFDLQTDIFIGGRFDPSADRHFHGRIAFLRVYGTAVTASEAALIFDDGAALLRPSVCNVYENFVNPATGACTPFVVPPCTCTNEYEQGNCQYEVSPRAQNADRVCAVVRACAPNEFEVMPPTATSDRRCAANTDCPSGFYESVSATPSRDRQCAEVSPPCNSATEWEYLAATSASDRVCRDLTVCVGAEYEVTAPTATSDRRCGTATVSCGPDQFQATPSPGMAPVCQTVSRCEVGREFEVAAPTADRDRQCQPLTRCRPETQYESVRPTASSDRACAPLTVCSAAQFELVPAQPDADRQCEDLTVCTAGQEFQRRPPSTRRDRECAPLSAPCVPGQYEVVLPTATADRECVDCPAGSEDADQNPRTGCTPCEDGTISVARSVLCTVDQFATVTDAFEVTGVVVDEATFVAAVTEVASAVDPSVDVEVVSYQQTAVSHLSIEGRPLSDFDAGTAEGLRLLEELQQLVAEALGVPRESVSLRANRRRLQSRVRRASVGALRRDRRLSEEGGGSPGQEGEYPVSPGEEGPDKGPSAEVVDLVVEVVSDGDVTVRMDHSGFSEQIAEELGLPSDAVEAEEPQVTTNIVTRLLFVADASDDPDQARLDPGRVDVTYVGHLLSDNGGAAVGEALRQQLQEGGEDAGEVAQMVLVAEEPVISFAEQVPPASVAVVQIRPPRSGVDFESHRLHDMDAEIALIDIFLGVLSAFCLGACCFVGYHQATKPKPLTADEELEGFGVLGKSSSRSETSDGSGGPPRSSIQLAPAGGGAEGRDHNPLVVRPGDDAAALARP